MKTKYLLLFILINILFNRCTFFEKPIQSKSGIYTPNKKWTFSATFTDSNNQITTIDTLVLKTENTTFMVAQNKIIWTLIHTFHPAPNQESVQTTDNITGLVDNEKELWMHPPRFDNYEEFTELAPFPKIIYPLTLTTKWNDQFDPGTHSSESRGNTVYYNYKVTDIDTISLNPLKREYIIDGIGKSKAGEYQAKFWFNDSDGFNKFIYATPLKNTLTIVLIKQK